MKKRWVSLALLTMFGADEPSSSPSPSSQEFKLVIRFYGINKDPVASADLVVRKGIAYQFLSDSPDEVVIIEPGQSRVVLLDLDRRIQTEVSAKQLDANLGRLFTATLAAAERREKTGTRADRVAAAMSRDLIDPKFKVVQDSDPHRLTLSNPSVEVQTVSEDEPDLDRLHMIMNCLAAINKLGALRDPTSIPPFTRMAALRSVSASGKYRPVEVTYLYRLAGPPRKLRWTYKIAPEVSDRERSALKTLETIRLKTRFVKFDEYEAEGAD